MPTGDYTFWDNSDWQKYTAEIIAQRQEYLRNNMYKVQDKMYEPVEPIMAKYKKPVGWNDPPAPPPMPTPEMFHESLEQIQKQLEEIANKKKYEKPSAFDIYE